MVGGTTIYDDFVLEIDNPKLKKQKLTFKKGANRRTVKASTLEKKSVTFRIKGIKGNKTKLTYKPLNANDLGEKNVKLNAKKGRLR